MAFYFGVFKEPRGLIRFLQLIFAICAFGTACNGKSSLFIEINSGNGTISSSWSYPFNLKATELSFHVGQSLNSTAELGNNNKPSAEFFVFTGVTSMLLSLSFLVVYIFLDRLYRSNQNIAFGELIVTAIWMIFWLAGSSAWAQGVTNIRSSTDTKEVLNKFGFSDTADTWNTKTSPNHGNIIVSVIFGFLNFVLWLGSIWFVYKETRFFKSNSSQQNNFSNIATPGFSNQPQTRPQGNMG